MKINQYTSVEYIYVKPSQQIKFSNYFVESVPCSYNLTNLQDYVLIDEQNIDADYTVTGNVLMRNCSYEGQIHVSDNSSLYMVGGSFVGEFSVTLGNNSMAILTDGSNLDFITEIYPITFFGEFSFSSVASNDTPAYGFIAGVIEVTDSLGYFSLGLLGRETNSSYNISLITCISENNFIPLRVEIPYNIADNSIIPPVNIPYQIIKFQ